MGCLVCNLINAVVIVGQPVPQLPGQLEDELCSDIATRHPEMVAKIFHNYVIYMNQEIKRLEERIEEKQDKD